METIHGFKRTSYCGEVTAAQIGQQAKVCGWVQKQRDLGNLCLLYTSTALKSSTNPI